MSIFKEYIRPLLHHLGLDVIRHRPNPRFPPVLRNRWLHELGTELVVDVGANVGQYAQDIRAWGYTGPIVSFEPLSAAFEELETATASDPLWQAKRIGLGREEKTAVINVAANSTSSSLLPMLERHHAAAPESAYVGTEVVKVVPLDSLIGETINPTKRIWLKIDVQGLELSVLAGAEHFLKQTVALECELSLVPLYGGEPLIEEALKVIGDLGFRLVMVTEAFFDAKTSRSLQLNGVFLRGDS